MRTEFESFVDYLKARKSKSTWLNRQSGLKKLNEWMDEKDYELEDLDAVTLESFLTWMANGDVSNRTAYEYITAVRLFFDWYEKRSDFTVNPARNVDTDWIDKDEPKHSKPNLTVEEMRALIESAPSMRAKAMISLMASTGIRAKECCQAEMDNLDLDERSLMIDTVKTDYGERPVYFDLRTKRILKKYIENGYREKYASTNDEYIFLSYNKNQHKEHPHVSTDRLRDDFLTAVENCEKIQDKVEKEEMEDGRERSTIGTHILRRSFSQHWIDNGGDLMSLKNHQGWENLETAKQYLSDDVDRETRDRYGLSL